MCSCRHLLQAHLTRIMAPGHNFLCLIYLYLLSLSCFVNYINILHTILSLFLSFFFSLCRLLFRTLLFEPPSSPKPSSVHVFKLSTPAWNGVTPSTASLYISSALWCSSSCVVWCSSLSDRLQHTPSCNTLPSWPRLALAGLLPSYFLWCM